jgi:hypothetical protein
VLQHGAGWGTSCRRARRSVVQHVQGAGWTTITSAHLEVSIVNLFKLPHAGILCLLELLLQLLVALAQQQLALAAVEPAGSACSGLWVRRLLPRLACATPAASMCWSPCCTLASQAGGCG